MTPPDGRASGARQEELIHNNVCSRLTDEELRAEERKKKEPTHYVYGISCSEQYMALRGFLIESLIPAYLDELKKT
jgi:hypothetical protein